MSCTKIGAFEKVGVLYLMGTDLRLNKSYIKPAAKVLAKAFQNDPLFVYFFPDASERENKLPHLFQLLVRYGVLYGEVYSVSPNLEGVAVWLPSEKAYHRLWEMVHLSMLPKIGREVIGRMWHCNQYATSVHKRHAHFRHWYLSLIGVDPLLQGRGYASILLKAMSARIDKEHLPCYLETQTVKNVSIYRHYGFKVVEKFIIPSTTEFSNWAMLREKVPVSYG